MTARSKRWLQWLAFRARKRHYRNVQQRTNLDFPLEDYLGRDSNENQADRLRLDRIFELKGHLTGRMLDVGCNDGYLLRSYPWRFAELTGIDIYGIDEYLRGRYREDPERYTRNGKIEFIQGFFEEYEFANEFDFVNAGEILEHVLDPDLFLDKVYQVLEPGGSLLITTPDDVGGDHAEHNRQFDADGLRRLLEGRFVQVGVETLRTPEGSWDFLVAQGTKPGAQLP